jgi:hypothetical protein
MILPTLIPPAGVLEVAYITRFVSCPGVSKISSLNIRVCTQEIYFVRFCRFCAFSSN